MRIGVSLWGDRLAGVAVLDDGEVAHHEVLTESVGAESGDSQPDHAAPEKTGQAGADTVVAAGYERLLRGLFRRVPGPTQRTRAAVSSIVFDLSSALTRQAEPRPVAVRIAPRPPIDAGHELLRTGLTERQPETLHIAGGCTTLGDDLTPLDEDALARFARTAPPGQRYVVTGVGSLVNPEQEERAGEILIEQAAPSSVDYSHNFFSSSFATREYTALTNSDLTAVATSLATALTVVSGEWVPHARLYVTTNDGGCAPLVRIPLAPVHSLLSGRPTELIGAASLCRVRDGCVVVSGSTDTFFGEISAGVPTVVPQHRDHEGPALATQSANTLPLSLLAGFSAPTWLVTRGSSQGAVTDLEPYCRVAYDLRARGAAEAPLSAWANEVVHVSNADEMQRSLDAAQARVRARLVSFGATSAQVQILEARVVTTAYEHPNVVSVRVRGIATRHLGAVPPGDDLRAA